MDIKTVLNAWYENMDGNKLAEDYHTRHGTESQVILTNFPNPCKTCGWSHPEHDGYWHERDLKNEILQAVNDALDGTGLSIARGTIGGKDVYQVVKVPTVVFERQEP